MCRRWLGIAFLWWTLSGCEPATQPTVSPPEPPPAATTEIAEATTPPSDDSAASTVLVYHCGAELRLVADLRGEGMWLFLPERTVQLTQVAAASGSKYEDDGVMLWLHGNEAQLELEGVDQPSCISDPAEAVWERAKLAGADFRALGQEPPWVLELYPERVVLLLDYGQTRIETPSVQAEEDQATATSRYDIETDSQRLTISLIGQSCSDSMSGESFETTVELELDGRHYHGCGRPLH